MTCITGGLDCEGASLVGGTIGAVAGAVGAVTGGVGAGAFGAAAGFPGRAMANFLPVLSMRGKHRQSSKTDNSETLTGS